MWRAVLKAAVCAVVVLLCAQASASASRAIRIAPAGLNQANPQVGSITAGGSVCPLVWRGFINQQINKTVLAELGHTLPQPGVACAGGMFTDVVYLPWTLNYQSFTGALPNITNIRFLALRFGLEFTQVGGGKCLYGGNLLMNWNLAMQLISFLGAAIPKVAGGILCPANIVPMGGWNLMTALTYTLV